MAETAPEAAPEEFEEPRQGGRVQAVVAGAVPALLGATAIWLSFGLKVGSLTDPGPGLWPLIVAVLLTASGVAIMWVAAKARDTMAAKDTEAFSGGTVAVLAAAGALAVYASLFEVVGFEFPTVLLLFAWLRFLGRESWLSSAVIAVVATVVAYALFIIGLGVPLPHLIAF